MPCSDPSPSRLAAGGTARTSLAAPGALSSPSSSAGSHPALHSPFPGHRLVDAVGAVLSTFLGSVPPGDGTRCRVRMGCAPMALCPTHSRAGAQHPKGQTSPPCCIAPMLQAGHLKAFGGLCVVGAELLCGVVIWQVRANCGFKLS